MRLDKWIKFRDTHLNCSGEIQSKAVGSGIYASFCDNFRPEVASEVISSVVVDTEVPVKYGDSRSNRSQDTRATHFVVDERRRRTQVIQQFGVEATVLSDRGLTSSGMAKG